MFLKNYLRFRIDLEQTELNIVLIQVCLPLKVLVFIKKKSKKK